MALQEAAESYLVNEFESRFYRLSIYLENEKSVTIKDQTISINESDEKTVAVAS